MTFLAIHAGDLHVRAAFMGALDAPAGVEDAAEPARMVTPSFALLDAGGPLLGYPALMACANPRDERVAWRYRRAALAPRTVLARDTRERGLTSESFLALAAGRLAGDARGYTSSAPELVIVVPGALDAGAQRRVARSVATAAGQPVRVVAEDAALFAHAEIEAGTWLVVSVDDDALRLRVVDRAGGGAEPRAVAELPEAGVGALRSAWLRRWNAEAAALVPGTRAFDDGNTYEFERLWQELWDALDGDVPDPARTMGWPLVRQSTVITLCVHLASLLGDVGQAAAAGAGRVRELRDEAGAGALDGVLIVASPAWRRALAPAIAARLGMDATRCRGFGPDAYPRGAALLAQRGGAPLASDLQAAPHALGVVGLGEDGKPGVRPLIADGQTLPATARFTIVADRDAQKHVSVTLVRPDAGAGEGYRFEFGPLVGDGMQRIGVAVEWRADGTLDARAVDRESGLPIPCRDCVELVADVPLAGVQQLRAA
jgi:hypothetical protein